MTLGAQTVKFPVRLMVLKYVVSQVLQQPLI